MATDLLQSLKSASLLPSPVLPSTFTPTYNLTVTFPSITPQNGALVRVHQVSTHPKITITPTDPPSQAPDPNTYTLLLIDPDAPTPADPKFAYWRHWVVSRISLPQAADQDVTEAGTTVTPYLAPGPKDESGPHRYLFVLLREREGVVVSKEDVGGDEFVERRSFGVEKFVREKGLEVVGVQWMRGVGDGWVEGKTEF